MSAIQEARRRIEALKRFGDDGFDNIVEKADGWILDRDDVLAILEDAERKSAEPAQDSAAPPRIYIAPGARRHGQGAFSTFRYTGDVEYVRGDLCKGDADE